MRPADFSKPFVIVDENGRQVWPQTDRNPDPKKTIHVGTWRESCASHNCKGCE